MRSLPRLWLCADLAALPHAELMDRVRRALAAGPGVVWLRSPPGYPAGALLDAAVALRSLTRAQGSLLLVGDRLDVALAADADGVHLAERSVGPADARRFARRELIVSCAVHDEAGIGRASGADALLVSPFGDVPGKGPPLGALGFARLRALAPDTFVVALGGITDPATARAAAAAGADAVALRRVLSAPDPASECAALLAALP
ncbi:MAG: thiamine phosphate synthase [Deltaproteobacteria bacterium]|nr:thiamine phosphate synthase [Myxococcales bacterium]MDP3218585.1 thiamine phosphate synthase [Deltaproteobacteria bacterium]